ncbi:MAG TPA: LysM peptidoglycan-binding domain-containing protein [Anaerolineales bacterium]|nr:LysM peptidoglycan-binding domain-containing protein [Anaerolineales bacterium]
MQISHEEAMRLIQFHADRTLNAEKEYLLTEHLRTCEQCRTHARQLSQMEAVLTGVMRKQWSLRPAPLAIDILTEKKNSRKVQGALLVTRSAIVSLAFLVFVMIGWQLTLTNNPANGTLPVMPVIPTPSTFYTATSHTLQDCVKISYQVKDSDTLASIAEHFSISSDILKEANHLSTEALEPNTFLLIPVCDSTPTSTINAPTSTITPILEPITRTPG